MKILDKIVFNRLIAILTGFVLAVLKLITMNLPKNPDEPLPPTDDEEKRPIINRIKKRLKKKD